MVDMFSVVIWRPRDSSCVGTTTIDVENSGSTNGRLAPGTRLEGELTVPMNLTRRECVAVFEDHDLDVRGQPAVNQGDLQRRPVDALHTTVRRSRKGGGHICRRIPRKG